MSAHHIDVDDESAFLDLEGTFLKIRIQVYKIGDEKIWEIVLGVFSPTETNIRKCIFIKSPRVVELRRDPYPDATIERFDESSLDINDFAHYNVLIPLTGGALLVNYWVEGCEVDLTGVYITEREMTRVAL